MNLKKLNWMPVLALVVLFSCKKNVDQQSTPASASDESELQISSNYVPNELLVKFKPDFSNNQKLKVLSVIGGTISENIYTRTMQLFGEKEGIYVIHTPLTVLQAASKIKLENSIVFAEPNYIYHHEATSNDPYYTKGTLWDMYGDASSPANQYGCQAAEAWTANHKRLIAPEPYVPKLCGIASGRG